MGRGFEPTAAFCAVPKMADVLLAHVFGPFGAISASPHFSQVISWFELRMDATVVTATSLVLLLLAALRAGRFLNCHRRVFGATIYIDPNQKKPLLYFAVRI